MDKFRIWDSNTINACYQDVLQIIEKIEETCVTNETAPVDLPLSMVPTDMLYDIASAYDAMYKKLLEYNLILAGYPKQLKNSH